MDVKILNRYKLKDKIGERPGAELYIADDKQSGKQVCVKILKQPGNYKKLLFDLQEYVGIKHPSVNLVHEISGDDHNIFIISDYLKGEDLKTKLLYRRFGDRDNFEFIRKIAEGLAPFHEKKLTHGNLRPSNVFITDDDKIILLDAGLSEFRVFQSQLSYDIPIENYCYTPPEFFKNKLITPKSDQYSLGVIAAQLVTGDVPFEGEYEDEIIKAIQSFKPEFNQYRSYQFRGTHILTIEKLLAKNPNDRFVSIDELNITLDEIILSQKFPEKYEAQGHAERNPHKNLMVSVVIALVLTIWLVLTTYFKYFG